MLVEWRYRSPLHHSCEAAGAEPARPLLAACVVLCSIIVLSFVVQACAMAEISIKHESVRVPLRLASFYELYKRFLKEHRCKWHDVAKLLSVVAEILFDVDGACSRLVGKVSLIDDN